MTAKVETSSLSPEMVDTLRDDIQMNFDRLQTLFDTSRTWGRLRKTGTQLWLDSGDVAAIANHWTREFSAVTVNNTLLSREIRKGTYDQLIPRIARLVGADEGIPGSDVVAAIAGMLNIHHGLRLVEKFDAHVSIEAHTALAHDVTGTVAYGRQAYAVCPERFYIKIPWTAAGILASRLLSREGIPVNLTLGFSARQNYVAARLAHPAFVNVFLGRLGSFVTKNNLGGGQYIGENATLASQKVITELRQKERLQTLQIGASFRDGQQVHDLVGIDVMTLPPQVAEDFLAHQVGLDRIVDRTEREYVPDLDERVDPEAVRLETLWRIDDSLVACIDELMQEDLDSFTPDDLLNFCYDAGCEDLFVPWSQEEQKISRDEGKIPNLENWSVALSRKRIGLDSLMNLAGLNAFIADQAEMDRYIEKVL